MTALAERSPAETLRDKAERVGELIDPLRTAPAAAEVAAAREERRRAYARLEDAVLDLSHALPQGTEDYDARKLFEYLVALRRALEADTDLRDERGEVELLTLQLQDVVRRIGRRLLHDELDDPRAAADFVFRGLASVGATALARLLGVSTKTIGAWRAGRPVTRNGERVVVVAQLVSYLRASLTPLGIVMWFAAPRDQLGGRTPLELLARDVASAREPLVALARGARGQLAS